VLSLERELSILRDKGVIRPEAAAALIARERRGVVSVYAELRFLTWAGVMMIVGGVGVLVSKHLDDIGPIALSAAIGIASAASYALAIWRRRTNRVALLDDYILLLAALLLSAGVGYVEHEFHLLGSDWQRHFLLLAFVHALTAYLFASRMVLSLAISSFAAFLGIERRTGFDAGAELSARAFICAALVFAWRFADLHIRRKRDFTGVFDHFATNLAFWGAVLLMPDEKTRIIGCVIAIVFAAISAIYGLRVREEVFIIYAWLYGMLGVTVLTWELIGSSIVVAFLFFGAIIGLAVIHGKMRRSE
jgi:hypothetical protein